MLDNTGTVSATAPSEGVTDAMLASIPDIEEIETAWAAAEPAAEEDAKPDKAAAEPDKPKDPDAKAATEDDDDDYIEFPADEEGKEPAREKLADVIAGWRKSAELATELEKAKAAAPQLPHEIEEYVTALHSERSKYVEALTAWQQLNQPVPPNEDLINPNSDKFDPEAYWRQRGEYAQAVERHRQVEAEKQNITERTTAEQEALRKSKVARERAEVQKFWPEMLADEKTRVAAKKALQDHFGIDDRFLNSDLTLDHRIYKLAKYALKGIEAEGRQAEAIKVVKAKPRLISGAARQSTNPAKSARSQEAISAFRKSGSIDDAMNIDFDF